MRRPKPTDVASEDIAVTQFTHDRVACLASRGVAARVIPPAEGGWGITVIGPVDGTMSVDIRKADDECYQEIGDIPSAPNTPEIAEQRWDRQLEIFNCLKKNGFTITAEPPSKETWVAQRLAGNAKWAAYSSITEGYGVFTRASKLCPQQR